MNKESYRVIEIEFYCFSCDIKLMGHLCEWDRDDGELVCPHCGYEVREYKDNE